VAGRLLRPVVYCFNQNKKYGYVYMKILPFQLDVTPPLGAWMAYCKNNKVDTPIYIRGIIVDDGESRAVMLSCDFISIWGQVWWDWRKAIAEAAGTSENRVFLHLVHQHDSMYIAPQLNEFKKEYEREFVSEAYCDKTINDLCRKISDLTAKDSSWHAVSKIMTAEKRIKGLAANRRMIDENGKCFAMRWSACSNEAIRELPTGTIDPMLKTIAFAGQDGGIITALHFYASHPMSAYKCEMVSQDVPGVAQDFLARNSDPKTLNIYFTGCGGNVAFGKYNTGEPEERIKLGQRLGEGMLANLNSLDEKDIGKLEFTDAVFDFPLQPEITEENMLKKIRETKDKSSVSSLAAHLIIARNWEAWRKCKVSRMSIGNNVHFLSLPGEMCVEYQLYAQSLVPEEFLACAAYANCSYHYIPTAKMYEEGGYEPEMGSISTAEVEKPLKGAIAEVLSELR
jgi:hypothetical protein